MTTISRLKPTGVPGSPYGSFSHTRSAVTNVWVGGAPLASQITTYALGGTWLATDSIWFKVGPKTVRVVVSATSIPSILTLLTAEFGSIDSTEFPEFSEMKASNTNTNFLLTASTAGKPFTIALYTDSANGTIDGLKYSTGGDSTKNSGPNDWNVPGNWSSGSVPITGDTVILESDTTQIWYGLDQTGITLAELRVTFAKGELGLDQIDPDGGYPQYRPMYLKIGATSCTIAASQSKKVKIDFTTVQTNCNVNASGSATNGIPAVLLCGTHASNVLSVNKGNVGCAFFGADSMTLATLNIGQKTGGTSDATVTTGFGCTLGTISKSSGTLTTNSAIGTSLTQTGGTSTLNGTGAVAQLTIIGGSVIYNTNGTLGGNTVISGSGFIDFSQDQRAKTVTNPITLYGAGARGSDSGGVITRPYSVSYLDGSGPLNWDAGSNYRATFNTAP